MDYKNKNILAPMVRIGTLPIRLLSLDYGADIVYTEELIDYKLVQCKRVENAVLGTIDFVWADGSIIYRTCPREKGHVVLQLGTADAERAEVAAKLVEQDVDGIDVNMGCPKEFSVKGGMGAALLKTPEKAKEILTRLVRAVSVPVTCKIRILDTLEDTIEFVRAVEQTGISAIGIHGRRKEERPRHDNHNDYIRKVAEVCKLPVIANGGSKEISEYADIEKFRSDTGASSVMIARRAQWNPSIFRKDGKVPTEDVVKAYLKYAVDYDGHEMNVKYCMQHLMREEINTPRGQDLMVAISVREICALWDMAEYYDAAVARRKRKEAELQALAGHNSAFRKRKLEDGSELVEMSFKYCRKEYPNTTGPKMILYMWTRQNDLPKPEYITIQNPKDRTFSTMVSVNGMKYSTTFWEKSKKGSEQAAAAVCLLSMGMSDGRREISNNDKTETCGIREGPNGAESDIAGSNRLSHEEDTVEGSLSTNSGDDKVHTTCGHKPTKDGLDKDNQSNTLTGPEGAFRVDGSDVTYDNSVDEHR